MAEQTVRRRRFFDPEGSALRSLAKATKDGVPEKPLDALQQVADLARELTKSLYAAVTITGDKDYVEGFVVSGLTPEEERKLKAPPQGHGPLGTMRQDGLTVRIDDLGEHARAFGFPPKHPNMKTLLGVPIWALANVRGSLYVADRTDGQPFGDDDERMLITLARHVTRVVEEEWY